MKYLLVLLISLPTFAARFADDIRSIDYSNKNELSVTFASHAEVHRIPARSVVIPCLEDGLKAKKPVTVITNDQGKITECMLSPRMLPGKAGH